MKKKSILFLPSNKNHVHLFHNIYLRLRLDYNIVIITQGSFKSEYAEKTLKEFNIPFKKFESYKEQNPNYILKNEKINLIIIGNDIDVIPQWFVNCSHLLKIPSILIQDGMLFNYAIKHNLLSKIPIMLKNSKKLIALTIKLKLKKNYKKISYGESNCTQIQVWGKNAKDYLESKKINPNKIVITGNPKFTTFFTKNSIPRKTHRIIYCPTSLIETGILSKSCTVNLIKTLCEVVSKIPEITLVIKPHPVENKLFYKKIIKKYKNNIELSSQSVECLLPDSDILITNLSTVSLDGIIYSKPVLFYFPDLKKIVGSKSFPMVLIKKKGALYAFDQNSLENQLKRILVNGFSITESTRKEILEEFYGKINSNPVENSVKEIKKLLN